MSEINRANLRKLAEAVRYPDWHYDPRKCWSPGRNGAASVIDTPQEAVFSADPHLPCVALTGEADDPRSMADAAYIAAADPTTVLALLDALDAAERERDNAYDRKVDP